MESQGTNRAAPWTRFAAPLDPESRPVARWVRVACTVGALLLVTAVVAPIRQEIGPLNIGLIYLIVVVGATVFFGRGAGILASLAGFALFDFFLVPPYLNFAIGDLHNILALFVFLGLSSLLSWLIAGAREQAEQAQRRAEDVSRLYELSGAIVGAQRLEDVLPAIASKVAEVFETGACWIFLPDANGRLVVQAQAPPDARAPGREETALANYTFRDAGSLVQTPGRAAFLPLQVAGRTIGVLGAADKTNRRPFTSAERTVLATFAGQAAVALERLELLREVQRAETLARADELKTALVSAVSHDLRTPLASILASVTSLLEPGMQWDEETRRDFLQGIDDEARRLNRLVGNLLDMSRIEGGALHPERDWYAPAEVIDAAVQRLEPRLVGHPLVVDVAADLPLARFDFSQIDQVLTNLLENAIKYTPPDAPIAVRARLVDDAVEVSVIDKGPGVAREQLAHLFERFYRVDGRSRPKGLGLGLAISKGLVEAHGGQIWADLPPEGGLQISFTLPLEQVGTRMPAGVGR